MSLLMVRRCVPVMIDARDVGFAFYSRWLNVFATLPEIREAWSGLYNICLPIPVFGYGSLGGCTQGCLRNRRASEVEKLIQAGLKN